MKYLFVVDQLSTGGAEKVLQNLALELKEKGDIVHILSLTNDNQNMLYEYELVYHLDSVKQTNFFIMKIFGIFRNINKIRKLNKKYKYDISISFLERSNVVSIIAGEFLNIPTLVSVRNNIFKQYSGYNFYINQMIVRLVGLIYKRSKCLVSLSKSITNQFVSELGFPKEKICTIYNNYNLNKFSMVQESCNYFIAAGRFSDQKNFKLMVLAYDDYVKKQILNNVNVINLKIYGDGETKDYIISLISQLGLSKYVEVCKSCSDVVNTIAKSKALLLTSKYEGFCNVVAEAQLTGVPVISVDCDFGPKEILVNEHNYLKVSNNENVFFNNRGIIVKSYNKSDFTYALCLFDKLNFDKSIIFHESHSQFNKAKTLSKWKHLINKVVV